MSIPFDLFSYKILPFLMPEEVYVMGILCKSNATIKVASRMCSECNGPNNNEVIVFYRGLKMHELQTLMLWQSYAIKRYMPITIPTLGLYYLKFKKIPKSFLPSIANALNTELMIYKSAELIYNSGHGMIIMCHAIPKKYLTVRVCDELLKIFHMNKCRSKNNVLEWYMEDLIEMMEWVAARKTTMASVVKARETCCDIYMSRFGYYPQPYGAIFELMSRQNGDIWSSLSKEDLGYVFDKAVESNNLPFLEEMVKNYKPEKKVKFHEGGTYHTYYNRHKNDKIIETITNCDFISNHTKIDIVRSTRNPELIERLTKKLNSTPRVCECCGLA